MLGARCMYPFVLLSSHAVASSPFARAANPPATLLAWHLRSRQRPTKGAVLRATGCAVQVIPVSHI